MARLDETPSGERVHISIFGRRNSGKSSLINALTNQSLAIVSDVPGTTTDPVSKSMEILPIGPVVITDTAGIDDTGDLGKLRVERTLRVLERTDVAVLVIESGSQPADFEEDITTRVKARGVPLVVCASKIDVDANYEAVKKWAVERSLVFVTVSSATRDGIEELKKAIIDVSPVGIGQPTMIGDLVSSEDIVVLVVPIDTGAPKGRLILPQVMAIRDALDHDAIAVTVKEHELASCLSSLARKPKIVITDSQAFAKVSAETPKDVWMTSFSIVMARYKGDLAAFVQGARAIDDLKVGDRVLISEGCTHHRQPDDIGQVKIPGWLRKVVGGDLEFGYSSGRDFPPDVASYKLIVHCGGCMLNPRELRYRQRVAAEAGVPMTNYGVLIAKMHGILDRALEPFALAR